MRARQSKEDGECHRTLVLEQQQLLKQARQAARRQRRAQATKARAAKQEAGDIQQRHASVQAWLNQQGRTGPTAAELRATRIQLGAAGVPQSEVRAPMRVLNQYKQPGG